MKTNSFFRLAALVMISAAVTACSPKDPKGINPAMVDNDATASGHAPSGEKPKMKFDKEVHDFLPLKPKFWHPSRLQSPNNKYFSLTP
jgi:hypothetical protein